MIDNNKKSKSKNTLKLTKIKLNEIKLMMNLKKKWTQD